MKIENDGIMVLDEGIVESLECSNTCCKVGPARLADE